MAPPPIVLLLSEDCTRPPPGTSWHHRQRSAGAGTDGGKRVPHRESVHAQLHWGAAQSEDKSRSMPWHRRHQLTRDFRGSRTDSSPMGTRIRVTVDLSRCSFGRTLLQFKLG